ncbi:hypothetical protein [Taklimakanibacter deserti]|uniref:hypothetical protein n=1 Tax=Taklimakanibacter deserti TaxID=2267839 RepID=UPI000E649295
MIDEAGAASAATESISLAQSDNGDGGRTDAPQASRATVERSRETARASVDRAFAALEQPRSEEADARNEAKPVKADAPGKDERAGNPAEAPARFSTEAKAAWADVPESVRTETHRAFQELNDGMNRYQAAFEPLKPYQQLAEKHGTTIHETLGRYVALDFALLSKTPDERMNAIASVLEYAGITPRDYAAQVMAQKPEATQPRDDEAIRGLRQELTDLRNELGGMSKSLEQRMDDEISRQVNAFAAENPRLKEPEVQRMMTRLLSGGLAQDLKSAFDMAVRLSPEPVNDSQPAASNAANRKSAPAQTRLGNLSITGAPGSGSNPARRKAPQTARESVDSAFASLGLG